MADGDQCNGDSVPEREIPFVDVKSLLDEAIFPLYRPRILNPVQESSDSLMKFRPDPDVRTPRSFRGFLERVATFQPQTWGADPNAALYFAKHGWRGTTDCNIHCNMCLSSIDCLHVLKKGELWFVLAKKGHEPLCPFQFISTPDDLFKLPTDPEVIQENVTKIWESLISLEDILPSITEEVISDLRIQNKVVESFFKAVDSPVSEFGLSALVLGLCGWVKGDARDTVECNFCQRCVGLWNFFSIADKTPSLQQEPLPSSSTEAQETLSPKPASPSICSEASPSQEIIPSDCEVPLDSNDYVSEEGSEESDAVSADEGMEEEEDDYEDEDSEDGQQSGSMNIVKSKSRSRARQRRMYDSNSEDLSEGSDDEAASTSNVRFRGQSLERNSYSLDSVELMERDRVFQLTRKLKKKAIATFIGTKKRFMNYKLRYFQGRVDVNVEPDPIEQSGETNVYHEIEDEEEDDDSDMQWKREPECTLEETNLDDVCNGSTQDDTPDSNFKPVLECPSPIEVDDRSVDPLDTPAIKRPLNDLHGEDVDDSGASKRRKVGNDPNATEITSIGQCTLVSVKDITSKLSAHGVTITKCTPKEITLQTETIVSQERGVKRKARSMDADEEEGPDSGIQRPRNDLEVNDTVVGKQEGEDLAVELANKLNDSKGIDEVGAVSTENSSAVSEKITSESTKKAPDGTLPPSVVEIPMDMRNGIDSSKVSSSETKSDANYISIKEGNGEVNNSNEISDTTEVDTVTNGDIEKESFEDKSSPKIPNGDSTVVSPDSRSEEQGTTDRLNGKLDTKLEPLCNSTTDVESEAVKANLETKTCGDKVETKADMVIEPPKPHVAVENHVEEGATVSLTNCKSLDVPNSTEKNESSAKHALNDVGVNCSVSETKENLNAEEGDFEQDKDCKVVDVRIKMDEDITTGGSPNDNTVQTEVVTESPLDGTVQTEIVTESPLDGTVQTEIVTESPLDGTVQTEVIGSPCDSTVQKEVVAGPPLETEVATGLPHDSTVQTEVIMASTENKPVEDVSTPDGSQEEVEKEECLPINGAEEENASMDDKVEAVFDKTEEARMDKTCSAKDTENVFTGDPSCSIKGDDTQAQADDHEAVKTDNKLQPVGDQDESTSAVGTVEKDEHPNVEDNDDLAMDVDSEVSKQEDIARKEDYCLEGKSASLDNGSVEDQENADEMEVCGPSDVVTSEDSAKQEAEEGPSKEYAVSDDNKTDEERACRKRRHSSVEEEEQPEEGHKKFKSDDPLIKVDFHPVNEHRFWCIYRLNTTTNSGDAKPGWAQLRDGLRLGLSMDYASCRDRPNLEDFRMRLAKHMARW